MAWVLDETPAAEASNTGGKWVMDEASAPQADSNVAKQQSEYGRAAQEGLGLAKGISDPFIGASQLVMHGLNKAGLISDEALKTHEEYYKNLEKRYQEATPEGSGVGRVIGNVATTLPLAFTPAVGAGIGARIGAGAATGAASGALQPVTGGEDFASEKLKQIAIGAGSGGIAPAIGSALAGTVSPKISEALKFLKSGQAITPQAEAEFGHALDVAKVLQSGGMVTPGQALGGAFKRAEDAATSIPITGDFIKSAMNKGIENFNRSAVSRALAPIGEKIAKDEPVGYALIDKAHNIVSENYDKLLPKLNPLKVDSQLDNQMSNVLQMSKNMHPDYAQQFDNIMQNEVFRKFTPAGTMSSSSMKEVESQLGQFARKFSRSQDGNSQLLGDALQEAQSVIRKAVERQNPAMSGALKDANLAWAELLRVENAAGRMGAKGGVFTPNQYEGAVRAMDQSLRKGQFARGNALGQDFATSSEAVLASKVPDSGTPLRSMIAGLAAGALSPVIPIAAAGAGALYTQPAQKALLALMTKRPDLAPQIAEHLKRISSGAGLAIPAVAQSRNN